MNNKTTIFMIFLVSIVILAGCTTTVNPRTPVNTGSPNTPSGPILAGNNQTGDVLKFNSINELNAFLLENSNNQNYDIRGGVMMESAKISATASDSGAPSAGADQYSQTNVQVAGVDEADFVKNDDKYIYLVQDNKLIIVDAFNNKEIVSETDLPKNTYANNMFLYKNRVVVLAQSSDESFYFNKYDIMPQQTYEQMTKVLIYDVSDKEDPALSETFKVSGSYFQSRMIDDIVYLVAVKYAQYPVRPPVVFAQKVINPDIYYFDNGEEQYNYNIIVSVDVSNEKVIDSEVYLLGYSNTLMMSEDNIYIAFQKQPHRCWGWYCRDNSYDKERFTDVVVPLLEGSLKEDVQDILRLKISDEEQWNRISERLTEFFNKLQDDEDLQDEYDKMFNDIQEALDDYDAKQLLENSKTIIHKIAVDEGELSYQTKGSADGRLLNQFSLDEYEGNLRVATTVDLWMNSGRKTYNNVYVLDEDMDLIGKVENIAKDEQIYSTRFMGDKLYMVTFRQVDPFFVIDLSDPKNPEMLGKLKIPGYSSYLHPYNEDFIIGVGKQTEINDWGGATIKGVKISLFDVSDFENPKEVDTFEMGMQGTDSPILYDHKAFLLFDDVLVIPISEITQRETRGQYGYDYKYWDGAYVFKVSKNGFDLIGKVKHDSRSSSYYNWYDRASVSRSIIMDNELFTISNKYIKMNDLENDLDNLGSITLPGNDNAPIYYTEPTVR